MLSSIRDGTRKGYDIELVARVKSSVRVPVIASGGFGTTLDLQALVEAAPDIEGICIGTSLHQESTRIAEIRAFLRNFEENLND